MSLTEIINQFKTQQDNEKQQILLEKLQKFQINSDNVLQIYNECISIRQKYVCKDGILFESSVAKYLDTNNIPYKTQVKIDKNGKIIESQKDVLCIIDFVILDTRCDSIIGQNIRNYIVLSVKKTARERWSQDQWTLSIVPRKYILLLCSSDYPSSDKFRESPFRKIITNKPKQKDFRKYKLGFNDLLSEIEYHITFMDLFCGIGSFHYSFKGFDCIIASDIFDSAVRTYVYNHKLLPMGDIHAIDEKLLPKCDIICSGNPCQSFSNIGQHKGFNDIRGNLFYEVIRMAIYHQPDFIIFENVEGLVKHDSGNTLKTMTKKIDETGYVCQHIVLKCSDYGIPQMRKRIFILCARKDLKVDLNKMMAFSPVLTPTLSQYLGKSFKKDIAYTIRCGGRRSPINDKHNWDGYLVDGKEYRLTVEDCLKLQGYENFTLIGSENDQFKMLGNTIPTNLTKLFYDKLVAYYTDPVPFTSTT